MRSVAICSWELMISVKKWLERVSNVYIGSSMFGDVLWVLMDLILFLTFFIFPFALAMDGGRCFMSYTVMLDQVVKFKFLMDWSNVFFTGVKRDAWYHLDRPGLLLSARLLSATDCFCIGGTVVLLVRLT